jgi:ribonuclease G
MDACETTRENGKAVLMDEEILINVAQRETRVAVLEQGLLQHIFVERSHARGIVSNIYKGKVLRILPGLQSAFVDFGHSKAGFIHVTDLIEMRVSADPDDDPPELPRIETLLKENQEILVQATKEPIGTKGARMTTNLSLASRYLVYLPGSTHIGVSQKIEEEKTRDELHRMIESIPEAGQKDGFIARTAAEMVQPHEILREAELLRNFWDSIKQKSRNQNAPVILYEDLPLHLKVLRDLISQNTQEIVVDSQAIYDKLAHFISDFIPHKAECLKLRDDEVPLFDTYNIEDQIQNALEAKVSLKSGGYLIIEQTEAMATIDVNSGGFIGRKDLEETIYRINLEAASAIPRQLRLRNMGGIIILDFIDMLDEDNKRHVLRVLEKGLQQDRVKCRITEISELGLVEMTRKRAYETLANRLCELCPNCGGKGLIRTAETICYEIFREIQRKHRDFDRHDCLIMASQPVIDRLLDEDAATLSDLSKALDVDIRFQVEVTYSQEQFDVVLI